jgi:hypothetical protein
VKFRLSTLLLAMAAICFLLPFVNVRCSQEAMKLMNQSVNGADSLQADATPTKGDLVFYYTGKQLVLGEKPTQVERQTGEKPAEGDSVRTNPEDSVQVTPPAPTARTKNNDPFRTVQGEMPAQTESLAEPNALRESEPTEDSVVAETPEMPLEEAGKPKPNIYALAALVLILIGFFGTLMKGNLGLVIGSVSSVIAVAMLNVMKLTFGTYLVNTGAVMKDQMTYYEVEFTGFFWLCIALCVLAFIELSIRLLTGWNENRPQVVTYDLGQAAPISSLYESNLEDHPGSEFEDVEIPALGDDEAEMPEEEEENKDHDQV